MSFFRYSVIFWVIFVSSIGVGAGSHLSGQERTKTLETPNVFGPMIQSSAIFEVDQNHAALIARRPDNMIKSVSVAPISALEKIYSFGKDWEDDLPPLTDQQYRNLLGRVERIRGFGRLVYRSSGGDRSKFKSLPT